MLPIVIVSILAVAGPSTAWPSLISRQDAALRANSLLIDTNPKALTLAQLIETANGLISANQVHSKSVGKILHALVGLEQLVQDAARGEYTCDSEHVERVAAIHKALEHYTSDGIYYYDENSHRRLNEQVMAFHLEYARACLDQYKENYAKVYYKQPEVMQKALNYLAILVMGFEGVDIYDQPWNKLMQFARLKDGQHVPTGKSENVSRYNYVLRKLQALFGYEVGFCKTNPKTGAYEVTVPEMRQFLTLIGTTCSHYEQQPEVVSILDQTDRLVNAIRPYYDLVEKADTKFTHLSKHTIGNLACRDMKLIDLDELAKRVAANVNKGGFGK